MSHDAIRQIIAPETVQLRMADVAALLADRDALAAEVERLQGLPCPVPSEPEDEDSLWPESDAEPDADAVPSEPPPKRMAFVGNPAANVSRWSARYTPNQCRLVVQMLADGAHKTTIAANARVTPGTVHDIAKAYRTQLEQMERMTSEKRDHYLASLYRQMLARWVAAGNEPGVQPEPPVPAKTLSAAYRGASESQSRGHISQPTGAPR